MSYARHTDPETSHEAAASLRDDKVRASQQAVLMILLRFGPMTDTKLIEHYYSFGDFQPQQSESGIRTRRGELVKKGRVRDSGKRERLASGRRSIVWEAVER